MLYEKTPPLIAENKEAQPGVPMTTRPACPPQDEQAAVPRLAEPPETPTIIWLFDVCVMAMPPYAEVPKENSWLGRAAQVLMTNAWPSTVMHSPLPTLWIC